MNTEILDKQTELDFANPLYPWAENAEKEHANWTPEALCIVWACGGRNNREWWNGLKTYERADNFNRPMTPSGLVLMAEEEAYKSNKLIAESWAKEIREAFKAGRRCPIKPTPQFEFILDWAIAISMVPKGCLEAGE